jgi:hypothetical protein
MDRALIFYTHIINWAHGRRDYPDQKFHGKEAEKAGLTSQWDGQTKEICHSFYNALRHQNDTRKALARNALKKRLQAELLKITQSEHRYGIIPPSG